MLCAVGTAKETAGPSTPLRSGRDDNSVGPLAVSGSCPQPVVPATTLVGSSYCGILGLTMAPEKTFYLETFGCQMNVHDSEKVIGTLRHEGYAQVDTEDAADLI